MPAKMCTSKGRWELFRDTERAKDTMLEADLNLERWLTVHQVRKLFTPTVGYNTRCSSWTRDDGPLRAADVSSRSAPNQPYCDRFTSMYT